MPVFIVALKRQFALYRMSCSLTTAMFVSFMFTKITLKCFSPAGKKMIRLLYVMLLCRIIINLLEELTSYLSSTLLLYVRKFWAWIDDKNKMQYVVLGTKK